MRLTYLLLSLVFNYQASATTDGIQISDLTAQKYSGSESSLQGLSITDPKIILATPSWHPKEKSALAWNTPPLRRRGKQKERVESYSLRVQISDRNTKLLKSFKATFGKTYLEPGDVAIDAVEAKHGLILPIKEIPPYGKITFWVEKINWIEIKEPLADPDKIAFSLKSQVEPYLETNVKHSEPKLKLSVTLKNCTNRKHQLSQGLTGIFFIKENPNNCILVTDASGSTYKIEEPECINQRCLMVITSTEADQYSCVTLQNNIRTTLCKKDSLFAKGECIATPLMRCQKPFYIDDSLNLFTLYLPNQGNQNLKIRAFGSDIAL